MGVVTSMSPQYNNNNKKKKEKKNVRLRGGSNADRLNDSPTL